MKINFVNNRISLYKLSRVQSIVGTTYYGYKVLRVQSVVLRLLRLVCFDTAHQEPEYPIWMLCLDVRTFWRYKCVLSVLKRAIPSQPSICAHSSPCAIGTCWKLLSSNKHFSSIDDLDNDKREVKTLNWIKCKRSNLRRIARFSSFYAPSLAERSFLCCWKAFNSTCDACTITVVWIGAELCEKRKMFFSQERRLE